MGVFKKRPKQGNEKPTREDLFSNDDIQRQRTDRVNDVANIDSEHNDEHERLHVPQPEQEYQEPDWKDGGSPAPKRLKGPGSVQPPQVPAKPVAVDTKIIGQPKSVPATSIRETMRLTAEIQKPLHTRLRIHAIKTDQTMVQVIEGWIRDNTEE